MLKKIDARDFEKVFQIMEVSFPEDERRTYEEQKNQLEKPAYQIYVWEEQEDMKGFAAVWIWEELLYIEHLAVNPAFRNEGLGSKILQEIMRETKKRICLEVEPAEEEMAIRRIGFYKRNGFFLNEYDYMQPPISKGRKEIPLKIMTSQGTINEEEFCEIRDLLYREVYNVR